MLGLVDEARKLCFILGYNYQSLIGLNSYKLLDKNYVALKGKMEENIEGIPSMIQKSFKSCFKNDVIKIYMFKHNFLKYDITRYFLK